MSLGIDTDPYGLRQTLANQCYTETLSYGKIILQLPPAGLPVLSSAGARHRQC